MYKSEEELEFAKKSNVKLFPIYKMFSWDLLFYYAIIFLFLTNVKGISAAQVLLADAFYPFFKMICQIPITSFADKVGKRNALIVGNIFLAVHILIFIISKDFSGVLVANLIGAIGFTIKGLTETNILYDSLSGDPKRPDKFSKLDGRGSSFYYYINAIASLATGYLFVINGYIPMVLCLVISLFSTYLSCKFTEVINLSEKPIKPSNMFKEIKTYIKDLRHSFKYMIKSDRLRCLLIFYGIISGLFSITSSLNSSLLKDMQIPEHYFGIIFAILGIICGFTAGKQETFHRKFRNRALTYISIPLVFSYLIMGLSVMIGHNSFTSILLVMCVLAIQYMVKGPFYTLGKRYLNSFTSAPVRTKITTLATLIESLLRTLMALFASFLLGFTETSYVLVIIGCIFILVILNLLSYMKTRVRIKT